MTERLAFTVRELADKMGVARDSVYSAIKRGEIETVKWNGRILVPAHEVDRLLGVPAATHTNLDVVEAVAKVLGVEIPAAS